MEQQPFNHSSPSSERDALCDLRHDLGFGHLSIQETVGLIARKEEARRQTGTPGWTPEEERLDYEVEHVPLTDFDFALPLIRSLAEHPDPHCRQIGAGAMKNLAQQYLRRYGRIHGLVSTWINLMREPGNVGESAYNRFVDFLDDNVADDAARGAIIDLTDLMRLRLQNPDWLDNPYPTAP